MEPLGNVLRHRKEFITIDDLKEYRRCRVQVAGRGIVLRDTIPGAQLRTKQQQVCRAGDFLVAEIDAKMGGFGLVPHDLGGAVVSSHYFLFEMDARRINPRYLHYLCQSPILQDQVKARGSTNYAAVRPHHVLDWRVPLPPLAEQERIVAKLDFLGARLAEIEALVSDREGLLASAMVRLVEGAPGQEHERVPVSRVVEREDCLISVRPGKTYRFSGVKSFGKGLFDAGCKIAGEDFKYNSLVRLRAGSLVFPKLMAWEGAFAVVPPEFANTFVSPEFVQFRPTGAVPPEVLDTWFRSDLCLSDVRGGSTGTNVRRNRLMPGEFLRLTLPLPPPAVQLSIRRVAAIRDRLNRVRVRPEDLEALRQATLAHAFSGRL